jgi:hypothetical protein
MTAPSTPAGLLSCAFPCTLSAQQKPDVWLLIYITAKRNASLSDRLAFYNLRDLPCSKSRQYIDVNEVPHAVCLFMVYWKALVVALNVMKMCRGRSRIKSHFPNLEIRWLHALDALPPGKRTSDTHWMESWVGLRTILYVFIEQKHVLPFPGIDSRTLRPIAKSVWWLVNNQFVKDLEGSRRDLFWSTMSEFPGRPGEYKTNRKCVLVSGSRLERATCIKGSLITKCSTATFVS